jgi:hypothetical protein
VKKELGDSGGGEEKDGDPVLEKMVEDWGRKNEVIG